MNFEIKHLIVAKIRFFNILAKRDATNVNNACMKY